MAPAPVCAVVSAIPLTLRAPRGRGDGGDLHGLRIDQRAVGRPSIAPDALPPVVPLPSAVALVCGRGWAAHPRRGVHTAARIRPGRNARAVLDGRLAGSTCSAQVMDGGRDCLFVGGTGWNLVFARTGETWDSSTASTPWEPPPLLRDGAVHPGCRKCRLLGQKTYMVNLRGSYRNRSTTSRRRNSGSMGLPRRRQQRREHQRDLMEGSRGVEAPQS